MSSCCLNLSGLWCCLISCKVEPTMLNCSVAVIIEKIMSVFVVERDLHMLLRHCWVTNQFPRFFKIFCSYLVTVMGLVTPWSVSLALVDAYSVFVKCLPRHPRVLLIIIVGDWVCNKIFCFVIITITLSSFPQLDDKFCCIWLQALSFLSLAAACSTASVTSLIVSSAGPSGCPSRLCSRYQLSAAMAFLSWFLSFASTLFNLWLLPSL